MVIEVQCVSPLCICNIYMPSRNSRGNTKSDDNYQSCLDQMEEVLNMYGNSRAVFIVGNFSASLMERRGNEQDHQFKAFVKSNSLGHSKSGIPTFFHPNKVDSAEIDYVLFYGLGGDLVSSVPIETKTASNISDHVSVTALLTLTPKYIELKKQLSDVNQNGTSVMKKF